MSEINVCKVTTELGDLARSAREALGLGLREAAPRAGVGPRFLSEFERGKPTSALGKVMNALQAVGLDLAVVRSPSANDAVSGDNARLSERIGTEFPYDWSNSKIDESTFIRKVLYAHRFNDVLKIVRYFGFERIASELPYLEDEEITAKVISMLTRIQKGMLLARCQRHADPS